MDTNIQKYMALIRTLECGSISKAAELLSYSQSAVSRMIQSLEDEWNISLLNRDRSGIQITSDGNTILPYIKSVCREYEKLSMQVNSINNLESGLIRIGIFSSIASQWMPKIIKHFQADYPKIDYELLIGDYDEIEHWILEGRVDCGFVCLPVKKNLDTIFLERDKLLVVLPDNYPVPSGNVFPLKEFLSYPFLLQKKDSNNTIGDILKENGIFPDIKFITWDDHTIMSMVENEMGISILPELILRRQPYKIQSMELEIPAYRDIAIAFKPNAMKSVAVKRFIEYLDCR